MIAMVTNEVKCLDFLEAFAYDYVVHVMEEMEAMYMYKQSLRILNVWEVGT